MREPFWKICSTRPQNFGGLKGKGKKKAWLYMGSFAYPINSSYKYVQKVKLNLKDNPNIVSETIELQKNVKEFILKFSLRKGIMMSHLPEALVVCE